MFSILGTIVVGLIIGVIARFLLPGKENFPPGLTGLLLTIVLGIAGSFLGGFIAGLWRDDGYSGWIMSIIGAVLLLLVVRMILGRGGSSGT
ncbi:MAG: GlsB/YeaQ/YmgE family stress response membrane protein [Blastocatellia bacterium]